MCVWYVVLPKVLVVYYDAVSIRGEAGKPVEPSEALTFRNAAMELIEAGLEAEQLGHWAGARITKNDVHFSFAVEDFDMAEAVIRATVEGTPYEAISEIRREEYDPDDY